MKISLGLYNKTIFVHDEKYNHCIILFKDLRMVPALGDKINPYEIENVEQWFGDQQWLFERWSVKRMEESTCCMFMWEVNIPDEYLLTCSSEDVRRYTAWRLSEGFNQSANSTSC